MGIHRFGPGAVGGGVSGSEGLLPTFSPQINPNVEDTRNPEGFAGNGDHFLLPTQHQGGGAILRYRNAAGTDQWTVTPSDVHTDADTWITQTYDSSDNLVYVIVGDESANRLYLASISSDGTLTNIGDDVTTASWTATNIGWAASTSARRGAGMFRGNEGSGDFRVFLRDIHLTIDSANGNIDTETNFGGGRMEAGVFPSSIHDDIFLSVQNAESLSDPSNIQGTTQRLEIIRITSFDSSATTTVFLQAPFTIGLPYIQNTNGTHVLTCLKWKGKLMVVVAGTSLPFGPTLFEINDFDASVDTLVVNYGAE